jgi:murein DD-endopeptidase MepM/ murein hydrolase activator NlpD
LRPGDIVRAGSVIAGCGNSGNSSEPHLHMQVMDHPRAVFADGIPFTFAGSGLPRNGEVLVASAA